MRYQEMCRAFDTFAEAHRQCSREWWMVDRHKIEDTDLIVAVEFDIAAASRVSMVPAPDHSEPRVSLDGRGQRWEPVRVTLFNKFGDRIDPATMTAKEVMLFASYVRIVENWVSGSIEALPPSTCTVLADRLRGGG